MAIVYFDSSAFVKLVVEEDGSELAAAFWDGCDAAVSSRLAYRASDTLFAVWDKRLRSGASTAGLQLAPHQVTASPRRTTRCSRATHPLRTPRAG